MQCGRRIPQQHGGQKTDFPFVQMKSTKASNLVKRVSLCAFLNPRFSSRVLDYAKKIVFRNRVTDLITVTVSLLCSI